MTELLYTNDAVLISYASALLAGEGIIYTVFDTNMSILEGSIGVLPKRLMVDPARIDEARQLMDAAGIMPC
jgi:hypothetical protein